MIALLLIAIAATVVLKKKPAETSTPLSYSEGMAAAAKAAGEAAGRAAAAANDGKSTGTALQDDFPAPALVTSVRNKDGSFQRAEGTITPKNGDLIISRSPDCADDLRTVRYELREWRAAQTGDILERNGIGYVIQKQ